MPKIFKDLSNRRQQDISKAIFLSASFETSLTAQFARLHWGETAATEESELIGDIRLCQEFGWSLEYCASLDTFQKSAIYGFLDAQNKLTQRASKGKHK